MIWYLVGEAVVFLVLFVVMAYISMGTIKKEEYRCNEALSEKYRAVQERERAIMERDRWRNAAAELAKENERLKWEAET